MYNSKKHKMSAKEIYDKLAQMLEKNNSFKESYEQHFIKKVNTFKHSSFDGKPLASMCAELTMCMWH